MKKILVVTNGLSPNISTLDFACFLAQLSAAELTGVLIDNSDDEPVQVSLTGKKLFRARAAVQIEQPVKNSLVDTARLFKEYCNKKKISFQLFKIKGDPVPEIVNESRFFDILVMDPDISTYSGEDAPSALVKDLLAKAECPVIVSPEKFNAIEEIIFCFDGSDSSVFAIKQFAYLFPQFKNFRLSLLEVSHSEKEGYNESHKKMSGWLSAHFPNVVHTSLKGDAKTELFKYLLPKENRIVVMGAYGRSQLSQFFRRSTADILIRDVDLPFFIAHL
jgi:nucleotide-binding universal stress UspA family protein